MRVTKNGHRIDISVSGCLAVLQCRRLRQRKDKFRSDPLGADHINIFPMCLYDLFYDCQTSIKGYLEAIKDGTIPPELYDKYLGILISETERLNKLTLGMLTLNSLDSKGFLTRSNFDINRVIKDTAATFEGTCNAKDIVLDLTFAADIQMVYADLG